MAHEKIRAALLFMAIMAIAGGISYAIANATLTQANPHETESASRFDLQGFIRDQAATYIRTNHIETAQFLANLSWTGGKQNKELLGAETYTYQNQGWNVTIKYPVVSTPVYNITFDYTVNSTGTIGIPVRIIWEGQFQNDNITETSYSFAQ